MPSTLPIADGVPTEVPFHTRHASPGLIGTDAHGRYVARCVCPWSHTDGSLVRARAAQTAHLQSEGRLSPAQYDALSIAIGTPGGMLPAGLAARTETALVSRGLAEIVPGGLRITGVGVGVRTEQWRRSL